MRFELHPEALARFHEIQNDLRASNPKRACVRGRDAQGGARTSPVPRAGAPIGGALRRMVLQRFSYSVLYAVEGDLVRITTIEPQQLEPDYWANDEDG